MAFRFTPKQVATQSLLLNNYVTGPQWYVDLIKSIAYTTRRLSPKQEACLDKLIANVSNTTVQVQMTQAQPVVQQVQNHTALFDFLRAATKHLQRPHVWIPLDPNKPITQSCDVIKVTYKPSKQVWNTVDPEHLDLVVRLHGNENSFVGSVDDKGVVKFRTYHWIFRKNQVTFDTIINTLNTLASDPVTHTSKWGKLLSRCCYCWLPLSTPESLAVGYGNICAAHFGLPWGKGVGVLTQTQALANVAHDMVNP